MKVQLRVVCFLVKFSKIFYNFTKIHFKSLHTKQSKIFFKNFLVLWWWVSGGVVVWSSICFRVYILMYKHTLYTLNTHILCTFSGVLWCFMHYLCSIYTLYSTKNLQNSKCKTVFTETSNIAPYSLYSRPTSTIWLYRSLKSHSHLFSCTWVVFNQPTI